MKYFSRNCLHDFEFHDSEFRFVALTDNRLTVSADCLNIHKGTPQNPYPTDMEIEHAEIVFHDFSMKTFEPGRTWKADESGSWYTDEPEVIITGADALEKFLAVLREGINVYQLEPSECGNCCIGAGSFEEPYFEAAFAFSSVSIEWDEYRKIAWYEENKPMKS